MTTQANNNKYAQLLKEQGSFVIRVGDVYWHDYSGFMLPTYLPHCTPPVSEKIAQEVLKESGRPFVRWDSEFGRSPASEWWFVLKRGPWSVENIKDKKKRWMIRQGQKNFSVHPLTAEEVVSKCPAVAQLAAARYRGKTRVETRQSLERQIEAATRVPGVLEYIGCFYEDTLASFSENYIQDNAVWLATIRHDPAYLNRYLSYGFLDGILDYYLNQKKFLYVLDGCRNIHHRTDFQEHLIKVFGFTKEYALLNVVYRPGFALGVKAAYPLRSVIWGLNRRWINSTLDKVGGILRQEYITKACRQKTAPLSQKTKIIPVSGQIHIRELMSKDARQAAELHIKGIQTGFISTLGIDFVTDIYKAIATSKNAFGLVALKGDKIIGFAAFAADTSALYRTIFFKKGLRFAVLLAGRLFSLKQIHNIAETILYPARTKKGSRRVRAELLSIVVAEQQRGKGISQALLQEGFSLCRKRKIENIKVLVASDNEPANRLYQKCGFTLLCQIYNHGILSNIYTGPTNFFQSH